MNQSESRSKGRGIKPTSGIKETELYGPIATYLENQGYTVKGEVNHCDLVAIRGDEAAVIVELKIRLNLELVLQAADRLSLSESVYIAFPASTPLWRRQWRRVRKLCHRLGIGIITLEGKALKVNIRLDPLPYKPRGSKTRQSRLLAEFEHRVGDYNVGGVTQTEIMTAYRQDALRCVSVLMDGEHSLGEIRDTSQVKRAASILQKNHYGWFERVRRGCYQLSPKGSDAAQRYAKIMVEISTL